MGGSPNRSALVITIVALAAGEARADSPKLEVLPTRVDPCLIGDDGAAISITLTAAAAKIDNVRIEAMTRTHASLDPIEIASLPPSVTRLWDVKLHRTGDPVQPGTVFVRAFSGSPGERALVAQTSFEIAPAQTAMATIATLTAKPPAAAINERHAGTAYVLVSSTTPYPLQATVAVWTSQTHPVVSATGPSKPVEVPAFGTSVVPIALAWQAIGKDSIVLGVSLQWNEAGCVRTGSLWTSFEVQTESPEVTAVLAAVGIPALLLLPGFLIMAVCATIWRLGIRIGKRPGDFPFPFTTPEFWLLAILFSFGALKIYEWQHKDLLETYRLKDVIYLWLASIAVGIVLYLLLVAVSRLTGKLREYMRHLPTEADDAVATLRKLGQRDQTTDLPAVLYEYDTGKLETWFRIAGPAGDPAHVWIAPGMTYTLAAAPPALSAALQQLRKAGDPKRLARWFRDHRVALAWDTKLPGAGPRIVELARLKPSGQRHIVQENTQEGPPLG